MLLFLLIPTTGGIEPQTLHHNNHPLYGCAYQMTWNFWPKTIISQQTHQMQAATIITIAHHNICHFLKCFYKICSFLLQTGVLKISVSKMSGKKVSDESHQSLSIHKNQYHHQIPCLNLHKKIPHLDSVDTMFERFHLTKPAESHPIPFVKANNIANKGELHIQIFQHGTVEL